MLRQEEVLKLGDDLVSQGFAPHVEHQRDGVPRSGWAVSAERYIESELQILCYFRVREIEGSRDARKCLAVIECANGRDEMVGDSSLQQSANPERDRLGDCSGDVEFPVLVGAVEFAEDMTELPPELPHRAPRRITHVVLDQP